MPLGSRKLGAFKNKFNAGVGGTSGSITASVSLAYSGNTAANLSYTGTGNVFTDATTITYAISTNRTNATFAYNMESLAGNVVAGDFADSTVTGNVTTDGNGDGTVTKTITSTTGSGHKAFRLNLVRPNNVNDIFVRSANSNLYEVVPANITGGNTTVVGVQRSIPGFSPVRDVAGLVKRHMFTANGNTTVNVVSTGNYNGNVNIWNDQFFVNRGTNHASNVHFASWDTGLAYRALIIGAGGVGLDISPATSGGGGSGELGVLEYPLNNVSAGSYVFTVGKANLSADTSGNTTIFNGNVALQKTAWYGGKGARYTGSGSTATNAGNGGSGGGGNVKGSIPAGFTGVGGNAMINFDISDLANKVTTTSFGNNSFKQYVKFANGNDGGETGAEMPGSGIRGGGGSGGKGDEDPAAGDDGWNHYGWPLDAYGGAQPGRGIEFEYSASSATAANLFQRTNVPNAERNVFGQRWFESPVYDGNTFNGNLKQLMAQGGPGGSGTDFDTSSTSVASNIPGFGSGTGVNGKDGLISITYPYRDAYRFVTSEDLS